MPPQRPLRREEIWEPRNKWEISKKLFPRVYPRRLKALWNEWKCLTFGRALGKKKSFLPRRPNWN